MAGDSLRDELLAIPGIAEAELEGGATSPAGVRVRLEEGADPDSVGRAVQEVLAVHGMRSHMTPRVEPPAPPPPPGAPGASVVSLPGLEVPGAATAEPEPVPVDTAPSVLLEPPVPPPAPPAERPVLERRLASVAVEEGRTGVTVRASSTDGRTASRRARTSGAGLDEAIVAAVAELVDPRRTPPLLLVAHDTELAGTPVVTVVLEVGEGERVVGSAVLEGGRAYAVAQAAWTALAGSH